MRHVGLAFIAASPRNSFSNGCKRLPGGHDSRIMRLPGRDSLINLAHLLNDPQKTGLGLLRGPSYTARGVHPTALPSLIILPG